jgi:hypothetical protein
VELSVNNPSFLQEVPLGTEPSYESQRNLNQNMIVEVLEEYSRAATPL